jgi:hypothetical protein
VFGHASRGPFDEHDEIGLGRLDPHERDFGATQPERDCVVDLPLGKPILSAGVYAEESVRRK